MRGGKFFFYRTISLGTSFLIPSPIFELRILSLTSLRMYSQTTKALFVVSRHITAQSSFTVQLISMKLASHPLKSTTLTNLMQCDLLKTHGIRWILQPSETAGKRLAFYLTWTCHHHALNPPFQSHLLSIQLQILWKSLLWLLRCTLERP